MESKGLQGQVTSGAPTESTLGEVEARGQREAWNAARTPDPPRYSWTVLAVPLIFTCIARLFAGVWETFYYIGIIGRHIGHLAGVTVS